MFKKRLFGYSKKQVDQLLTQVDQDFHTEEERLKLRIKELEESCELLKKENDSDKAKVYKAKVNYRFFRKSINALLVKNSK